jgi:hypothetical protein
MGKQGNVPVSCYAWEQILIGLQDEGDFYNLFEGNLVLQSCVLASEQDLGWYVEVE